ncbi:hypothetical protein F5888DRAFT_1886944 [Russula emetica]|nr:hypothetical protein F5888DRAFT_1886944 [Russula emetica]
MTNDADDGAQTQVESIIDLTCSVFKEKLDGFLPASQVVYQHAPMQLAILDIDFPTRSVIFLLADLEVFHRTDHPVEGINPGHEILYVFTDAYKPEIPENGKGRTCGWGKTSCRLPRTGQGGGDPNPSESLSSLINVERQRTIVSGENYLPTRRKRRREERSFAVPESIIVGDRGKGVFEATSIDPKGYLSSLDSQVIKTEAEIGGIKRARMLFDSLIKSNPKHAPGWIAAAALEEHAGRMLRRAHIITQQNDDAKIILANAAQHVGQSVKIWLVAADLKHDGKVKKRVLRRALEHIPNLVRLWKETINLETSPADARILLSGAVEVIPLSIELWLALARLETPEKAIGVLNKARKAVPTSQNIGLPQGEATEELERVDKTLATAVRTSRAHGILLTREKWLTEAERCEAEGSGRVGTAGAVLAFALRVFPDRPDFWRRTADLEKAHGTHESLDKPACACRRVLPLGGSPVQWLMWAKGKWLGGDVRAAREVLERAFVRNSESEQIWLAAVKLEAENGELAVARELLIWLKSAVFERQQGQSDLALKTVTTALSKYPKFAKLYMVQGQIHQAANKHSAARAAYAAGIKAVPKDFTLRVLASRLEEADGKSIRARALLEKARLVNPKSDVLWAGRGAFRRPLRGRRCLRAARMPNIRHALVDGNLVARLYWADRRIEEAREWFERAVSAGPDLGDAWGCAMSGGGTTSW